MRIQPTPVILDRHLQSPPSCRLFHAGRVPVILYTDDTSDPECSARAQVLKELGCVLHPFKPGMSQKSTDTIPSLTLLSCRKLLST